MADEVRAPENWTPEQVAEFQRQWDEAAAGKWIEHQHVRWLASGQESELTVPQRSSFEFSCAGPAWQGIPLVNGHIVPVSAIDVHIDPAGFPEVTLRFPASDAVKLGFGSAQIGVDDGTREALISLGWTPPAD